MARKNDKEMYSTHNLKKYVIAGRFIRTLKNKILKYMTSRSQNVCIDKLNDTINKYYSTYHGTIKMELAFVKVSTCTDDKEKINDQSLKFEIGDIVRISKYKNIFAKGNVLNWSEEVSVITKVKDTIPWSYVFSKVKDEEFVGTSWINNNDIV